MIPGGFIAVDPVFKKYKEGPCIEPVVASVSSTRQNDALEENHKGGIGQRASRNNHSRKKKD